MGLAFRVELFFIGSLVFELFLVHLYSLGKWNDHKGYGINILVTNIINLVAIKLLVVGSNCVLVVIRVTTIVGGGFGIIYLFSTLSKISEKIQPFLLKFSKTHSSRNLVSN